MNWTFLEYLGNISLPLAFVRIFFYVLEVISTVNKGTSGNKAQFCMVINLLDVLALTQVKMIIYTKLSLLLYNELNTNRI